MRAHTDRWFLIIFGPKRSSNKKQKKKLYNKNLHKIYYSPNTAKSISKYCSMVLIPLFPDIYSTSIYPVWETVRTLWYVVVDDKLFLAEQLSS